MHLFIQQKANHETKHSTPKAEPDNARVVHKKRRRSELDDLMVTTQLWGHATKQPKFKHENQVKKDADFASTNSSSKWPAAKSQQKQQSAATSTASPNAQPKSFEQECLSESESDSESDSEAGKLEIVENESETEPRPSDIAASATLDVRKTPVTVKDSCKTNTMQSTVEPKTISSSSAERPDEASKQSTTVVIPTRECTANLTSAPGNLDTGQSSSGSAEQTLVHSIELSDSTDLQTICEMCPTTDAVSLDLPPPEDVVCAAQESSDVICPQQASPEVINEESDTEDMAKTRSPRRPAKASRPARPRAQRTTLSWVDDGKPYPCLDDSVDHCAPNVTHLKIKNSRYDHLPPLTIEHIRHLDQTKPQIAWTGQEFEARMAYISPDPPSFFMKSQLQSLQPGQMPQRRVTSLFLRDHQSAMAAEAALLKTAVESLIRTPAAQPQPSSSTPLTGQPFIAAHKMEGSLHEKCSQLKNISNQKRKKRLLFGVQHLRDRRTLRAIERFQSKVNPNFVRGKDEIVFGVSSELITQCWEQKEKQLKKAQQEYSENPLKMDSGISDHHKLLFSLDPDAEAEFRAEQEERYKPSEPEWDEAAYLAEVKRKGAEFRKRMCKTPEEIAEEQKSGLFQYPAIPDIPDTDDL